MARRFVAILALSAMFGSAHAAGAFGLPVRIAAAERLSSTPDAVESGADILAWLRQILLGDDGAAAVRLQTCVKSADSDEPKGAHSVSCAKTQTPAKKPGDAAGADEHANNSAADNAATAQRAPQPMWFAF